MTNDSPVRNAIALCLERRDLSALTMLWAQGYQPTTDEFEEVERRLKINGGRPRGTSLQYRLRDAARRYKQLRSQDHKNARDARVIVEAEFADCNVEQIDAAIRGTNKGVKRLMSVET